MTNPTDEELDALVQELLGKQVCTGFEQTEPYTIDCVYGPDPVCQHAAATITSLRAQLAEMHRFKERIIAEASDAIEAIGKRCAAANARADRAEAALAAQIEADAGIADDYVEMRERSISTEKAKAAHHIDVPQLMRWLAGKDQSQNIADAIRAQPHSPTALDRVKAEARADAIRDESITAIRGVRRWQPRTHGPHGMNEDANGNHVKISDVEAAILALLDKEGE